MSKLIEMIAQFLTKLTGSNVSNVAATGVVVVIAFCIIVILFGVGWHNSEQRQWDELRQWEEESEEWDD